MSEVTVNFFGPARDLSKQTQVSFEIGEGETVGVLAGRLAEQYPALGAALGLRLAVNCGYVALDHVLRDGDEVAVIPPVSGGAPTNVSLTRDPIDIDRIYEQLQRHEAGAVATFIGTVRAESREGRELTALDYSAYEDMALEQMNGIRRRAGEKFEILDSIIVHRLGKLGLGEISIAVGVASAHRVAAFEACHWIVDMVKTDAPIWKQDCWSDGSQSWVDPTC